MRAILAGLVLLSLTAAAAAQATGDVEAIGFAGGYRSGCWTPMLVRLQATTGKTQNYKLVVIQKDLDKDHIFFSETIPLQGNPEGSAARDQRFWMYFIPDPSPTDSGGIPQDVCNADLNAAIRVLLYNDPGPEKDGVRPPLDYDRPLMQLNVTQAVQAIDTESIGRKLVLFVSGQSRPVLSIFASAAGMNEKVEPLLVDEPEIARTLPDNVIGYDAVDAIVWLDADPGRLSESQETAIRQYVRRGGKLVVCQSAKPVIWQTIANTWADLLPVNVDRIDQIDTLEALPKIADDAAARINKRNTDTNGYLPKELHFGPYWELTRASFDLARARAKPGAMVDVYDNGSPYIVHGTYGRGGVTWVAQDLGDPHLTGNGDEAEKWLFVWNKVFDWHNDPIPYALDAHQVRNEPAMKPYEDSQTTSLDLGFAQAKGMELPSTGAAYIALVVLFFILYWAAAGPASYLLLASRKRVHMSWFAFAAIALVATAATAVIVRLVLRGPGKLQHVSYVCISSTTPGCPAIVRSDFGLYIPKDSVDGLAMQLEDLSPDSPSYLIAYPIHSAHLENSEGYTAYQKYEIPVRDDGKENKTTKTIYMPYRSTLKKFEACWIGNLPGIEGSVQCVANNQRITGTLVNHTGKSLHNIYVAFRGDDVWHAPAKKGREDYIYFTDFDWSPGGALDLHAVFGEVTKKQPITTEGVGVPCAGHSLYGVVDYPDTTKKDTQDWNSYWCSRLHPGNNVNLENSLLWTDEDPPHVPMSFPLLSLFDRVPAFAKKTDEGSPQGEGRMNLLRQGKRQWDVSQAIAAGKLVVLAQCEGEIPIPLKVEGREVESEGTTFYQFILPLDWSTLEKLKEPAPATQPATRSVAAATH